MKHQLGQDAMVAALFGVLCLSACVEYGDEAPLPLPPPPATRPGAGIRYIERRPFLESERDYYVPDSFVGHLHRAHACRRHAWPEHPRGEIVLQTNNLGLREDVDTLLDGREDMVTVLVTGDSHTDGVVWNSESFPNVVERELTRRYPSRRFDVLNGGVGYFGPYNYSRWVERYAFLDPAMVIVLFYTGNDFLDCAQVLESTGMSNERGNAYYERLNALPEPLRLKASQHLNQAYYLSVFPHMQEHVLDFAEAQLARLAEWCTSRGVELVIALLPDEITVERDDVSLQVASQALALRPEELTINRQLSVQLAARLEVRHIDVLDLEPSMAGQEGLYWSRDHHLSSDGHRVVAEALLQLEGDRFGRLEAAGR